MVSKTALYNKHVEVSAKMVDFGGWDMPVNYGSQIEEHHAVRQHAGMFDVSHMTVIDVAGPEAQEYLRYLLANDVSRLVEKGKALYSGMLNQQGGVIDDLIVYQLSDDKPFYRVVVNASTREKDLAWMRQQVEPFDASITERDDVAMVAVQGPQARKLVAAVVTEQQAQLINSLNVFQGLEADGWFIARTGYTGEDGLEIMLPHEQVENFWQQLLDGGVRPIGLGARDTLRLEAGMNLYGSDMDEKVSPLQANMAWTIAWQPEDRNFIGRESLALEKKQGSPSKLVGLILEERGVLRGHQKVVVEGIDETGEVTSGTFSPTMGKSIALARVPASVKDSCFVEVRGKLLPVRVVTPPFVRHGKVVCEKVVCE